MIRHLVHVTITLIVALLAALPASSAELACVNVGYRVVDLKQPGGAILAVAVWYPTSATPLLHVYGGPTTGRVAIDAEPRSAGGPYPLFVFSHGYGGCGLGSVFLTETLAARGWIVAAPDHRDRHSAARIRGSPQAGLDRVGLVRHALEISRSGPAEREAYRYRVDELRAVLDGLLDPAQFGKLVDPRRIAVGGHSFGGFAALGLCGAYPGLRDERVKAAVLLSSGAAGYLYRAEELATIKVPTLYMLGEQEASDRRGAVTMGDIAAKIYGAAPEPKYFLELRGGRHASFVNALSDGLAARLLCGSAEQFDVIRRYATAFLERHVAGRPEGGRELDADDPLLTRRLAEPRAGTGERATSGDLDRTLRHGGLERRYRLHVPRPTATGRRAALVVALHGGYGDGAGMQKLSARTFDRLADRDGFVVAYPDGIERHWNDGRRSVAYRAHATGVDDVGFLGALIDTLVAEFDLDANRVYATGASNGAMMCYRLALALPGKLAAIAPVMCPLQKEYAAAPLAERIPLLIIHGTDDPLAPFDGGRISGGFRDIGEVLSIGETVRFWVDRDRAAPAATVTALPDADPADGTRVKREEHAALDGGAEVLLYVVLGGGHTWPGGSQYLPQLAIGRTCRDFDAAAVIWEFFQRHARRSVASTR